MNFTSLRDKLVNNSAKLLFIVVSSMIVLVAVFSVAIINTSFNLLESKIYESLSRKGQLLTKNNGIALIGMVEDNAFSAVESLVASTVAQDPDIEYGIFMDETLMVWVHHSEEDALNSKTFYTAKDEMSLWAHEVIESEYKTLPDNEEVLEFVASVISDDEKIGTIRYGINTSSMTKEIRSSRDTIVNFLYIFVTFLIVCGTAVVVFTKRLGQKQADRITEPLGQLTYAANTIASGDYSNGIEVVSDDEIGVLAHDFDIMRKTIREHTEGLEEKVKERTAQLEEAQREAVDNAHKAGMADVATGTLHNIGNLLNSVVTSTSLIKDTLHASRLAGYYKAMEMLKAHENDLPAFFNQDPRAEKLISYLLLLEKELVEEHKHMHKHMDRLIEKIGTMSDAIAAQQEYAHSTSSMLEPLDLHQLVEDAITMTSESISKHDIIIDTQFNGKDRVMAQKNKVIQILINLIINAREAMSECDKSNKKISINFDCSGPIANLRVSDTGCGISKDNLDKIFNHGFTTKKNGHGFGLHSSANYMTEMGGRMWVDSEGLSQGATFTLEFALEKKRKNLISDKELTEVT